MAKATRSKSRSGDEQPRVDTYQRITDKIVAALEAGVRPWSQPWSAGNLNGRITRPLRHNRQPYSGINVVLLWMEAEERGYGAPIWMTFRQALALGGCVRKGEKGTGIVYADRVVKREERSDGATDEKVIPFLKCYTVFNVEQIDGLPENYYGKPEPVIGVEQRDQAVEAFFGNLGADIRHGGTRAFYAAGSDHVQMPPFQTFRDAESYYATLAHECVHWTKHQNRLDRDFGRKRWGDEGYAAEELTAELGAAFLAADLGLSIEPREDHAGYIESWLKVLKGDKKAIFTAAGHAARAAEFLHGLQPAGTGEGEAEEEPLAA